MSGPPERANEVGRWLQKAEHDFMAAEHMMQLVEQGLTDIVCFHCQQCAEKYLKALLVYLERAFPKTHDLRLLLDLLADDTPSSLRREEVIPLNRYAIEGRYPGAWESISATEARRAFEMAGTVRQAVIRQLPC